VGQTDSESLLPGQQHHRENYSGRISVDCEEDGRRNGFLNELKTSFDFLPCSLFDI
jgi:ribosomal protein S14